MKTTEIAWAAGFFDGEGTAYAARNGSGRRYLVLTVANTEREALLRMQRVIGGRIYEQRDRFNTLARKPLLVLKIMRREEVQRAVDRLWPYLGTQKRSAILDARRLEEGNPPLSGRERWETRRARYGPSGRRAAA
jgi:hypothetical protein